MESRTKEEKIEAPDYKVPGIKDGGLVEGEGGGDPSFHSRQEEIYDLLLKDLQADHRTDHRFITFAETMDLLFKSREMAAKERMSEQEIADKKAEEDQMCQEFGRLLLPELEAMQDTIQNTLQKLRDERDTLQELRDKGETE